MNTYTKLIHLADAIRKQATAMSAEDFQSTLDEAMFNYEITDDDYDALMTQAGLE